MGLRKRLYLFGLSDTRKGRGWCERAEQERTELERAMILAIYGIRGGKPMIAICREVCRETGRIIIYPLKMEVTDSLLNKLRIRSVLNPELQYYVTLATTWDAYREVITRRLGRNGKLNIFGVERI